MNIPNLIAAIQRDLKDPAIIVDGKAGPKTWGAIYKRLTGKEWVETEADAVDERSERNIATLLPEVRPYARALVRSAAAQGIKAVITSGTRTYAEQDALYAQGRTKAGEIVTNAKGGQSNHNFGIAFDVTLFSGAKPIWESPRYREVGTIGEQIGLKWGGRWKKPDEPHYEYNPRGYTVSQMRELVAAGKSVLV